MCSSGENRVGSKDASNKFLQAKVDFFFRVTWSKEIYKSTQIIYLSSVPVSFSFPLNSEVLPVSLQRPCDNVTNIRAAKC